MNNIISPFQMEHNKVASFSIEQNEGLQEFESTNVSLGADFKISELQKRESTLTAKLNLLIELTGKTDKDEKVFKIKLDMLGAFECDIHQINEEKFVEMLKINGISTLMQLSRAYVTSVTALSGFSQPINFPMVNVFELVKWKENTEKENRNKSDKSELID